MKKQLPILKNYKAIKRLGSGSYGEVFHVKDKKSSQEYALKSIFLEGRYYTLKKEIQINNHLYKRNLILKLHGKIYNDEDLYLLYEYADGGTLTKEIKNHGVFTKEKTLQFLHRMVDILGHIHTKNIVHNDIKDENIVLKDGEFYLIDFGLSERGESHQYEINKTDENFLAPERLDAKMLFASDIYSLGCVLYYVLHGKVVYGMNEEHSEIQKAYRHAKYPVIFDAEIDGLLQEIIKGMLEKDPAKRLSLGKIKSILKEGKYSHQANMETFIEPKSDTQRYHQLVEEKYKYLEFKLGLLYKEEEEFKKTIYWYEQAAKNGFAKAINNLAYLYDTGEVVEQDMPKAVELYKQAAELNNKCALYNLGKMYYEGIHVPKDRSLAYKYYLKSAQQDYGYAKEKLLLMCQKGEGTCKSRMKYNFWKNQV